MESGQISIAIADAQPVFRKGLITFLDDKPEYSVISEASNTQELVRILNEYRPDILILDFNVRFFDANTLNQTLQKLSSCKVIIISSQEKPWQIYKSLELNVYCYLTKECGFPEIFKAINSAVKGEKFICNYIMEVLLENKVIQSNNNELYDCQPQVLTAREIEITRLVAKGHKNKDIADILSLSPHTIHTHRKNILKKLGINSALELTNYAYKIGIIEE